MTSKWTLMSRWGGLWFPTYSELREHVRSHGVHHTDRIIFRDREDFQHLLIVGGKRILWFLDLEEEEEYVVTC